MMTEKAVPLLGQFLLEWNRGGISSLKLKDDVYDTEYVTPGETLGEVLGRLSSRGRGVAIRDQFFLRRHSHC